LGFVFFFVFLVVKKDLVVFLREKGLIPYHTSSRFFLMMKKRILTLSFLLILAAGIPGALWIAEQTHRVPAVVDRTANATSNAQAALSPVVRFFSWGADSLSGMLEYFVQSGTIRKENSALSREVAKLQADNQMLREAISKYKRLEVSAEIAELNNWKAIPADVIAWNSRSWSHSLVINRGTNTKVEVGDPVLYMNGLAGVVYRTTPWTATVQLLTDSRTAIGVCVGDGNEAGMLMGSGSNDHLEITLKNPSAKLRSGDKVVSSGMTNSLYPRGLPIGVVAELTANPFGDSVGMVRPYVSFGQMQEVVVLKTGRSQTSTGPTSAAVNGNEADEAP
jgi:rod shape-determining protein MreC